MDTGRRAAPSPPFDGVKAIGETGAAAIGLGRRGHPQNRDWRVNG